MKPLSIVLIIIFYISIAHANGNTLKIAISTNMSPYSFINEKNNADGILVDYWKLWSKKNDIKIKFVPLLWSETLIAIRNKTVHIHAGLFKTKERSHFINYLNKIYNVNSSIYINRNDRNTIRSIQDLKDRSIGVIKDSYFEHYITNNYSEIKVRQYRSYMELQEAIKMGDINSVIADDLVIWMNIIRHQDYNQLSRLKSFTLNNWFYAGIIKGDKELEKIVLSGMDKINDNDMIYLEEKWIINKELRYFSKLKEENSLTKKEKEFILNHPIISYSTLSRGPVSIIEDGNLNGLMAEYIKIIEEKTGLNFVFEQSESWNELNEKFKNKKIDLFPTIENLKYVDIKSLESNKISSFHFGIITNKDGVFADEISDLSSKVLALVKGSPSFHLIKNNFPDIRIIEAVNIKEALSLISQGQAYAFVGPAEISIHYLKEFFPELKIVGITEDKLIYHFLIQNNYPELLSIINKVLDNISPNERKSIRSKWINEEINTAINYTLIYQILMIFAIILFIIFVFMKKLSTAKTNIELTNGKLEISNKTLLKTIENLKETQEQLFASEKMAALGELVAGVAHEINTPVGIGLTGISHLEDSTKDIVAKYKNKDLSQEEFDEYLSVSNELSSLVHKNLKKAAQLVKSFKQVAVDQSSEEQRTFNLNEYLNEILASIHSLTKKTLLEININCPENIIITSYPGALSQVISNLIMNSIVHGFEKNKKGSIVIAIEKKNKTIELTYKDNGKGISKENLPKIFNPFFTTKRNAGGSGLGLNIIYNIIETTLNGTISCESKENVGTKFSIIFKV